MGAVGTPSRNREVAVVTGGSKGIGRAVALALADLNFDVAVLDPLASDVGREVESRGVEAIHLKVDVSDEEDVRQAAADVIGSLGSPTVLVNNAGIYPRTSALDVSYQDWLRVIHVNLGGAFLCARTFAPGMLTDGRGSIVNISSGRAFDAPTDGSHYASSKGGLITLTRALAKEWAPTIRVNTVVPGITDTDQPREGGKSDEEVWARGKDIPLGRVAQPEDIAAAVTYLTSDSSRYITGQTLCVNGGALMH